MAMLISLVKAKAHLRVDHDDEDDDIELKLLGASAAILDYLKDAATFLNSDGDTDKDSNGDPQGVPFQVQAATLLMLGILYKNREPESEDPVDAQYGYGYLPKSVVALLYPLRTPTLA